MTPVQEFIATFGRTHGRVKTTAFLALAALFSIGMHDKDVKQEDVMEMASQILQDMQIPAKDFVEYLELAFAATQNGEDPHESGAIAAFAAFGPGH